MASRLATRALRTRQLKPLLQHRTAATATQQSNLPEEFQNDILVSDIGAGSLSSAI